MDKSNICVRHFMFCTHVHLCSLHNNVNNLDGMTNIIHMAAIFVLFFQIYVSDSEIFVLETSNFIHMYICVLQMCIRIILTV